VAAFYREGKGKGGGASNFVGIRGYCTSSDYLSTRFYVRDPQEKNKRDASRRLWGAKGLGRNKRQCVSLGKNGKALSWKKRKGFAREKTKEKGKKRWKLPVPEVGAEEKHFPL